MHGIGEKFAYWFSPRGLRLGSHRTRKIGRNDDQALRWLKSGRRKEYCGNVARQTRCLHPCRIRREADRRENLALPLRVTETTVMIEHPEFLPIVIIAGGFLIAYVLWWWWDCRHWPAQ